MNFFKRAFSEAGEPSSSRLLSGFVIFIPNIWITFLVFKNGQLPDFGGITLWVTSIVGVILGLNKAPAIAGAITGTIPPPAPSPPAAAIPLNPPTTT
jgi:hypothetical protein